MFELSYVRIAAFCGQIVAAVHLLPHYGQQPDMQQCHSQAYQEGQEGGDWEAWDPEQGLLAAHC